VSEILIYHFDIFIW
jgi:hypothetical protein